MGGDATYESPGIDQFSLDTSKLDCVFDRVSSLNSIYFKSGSIREKRKIYFYDIYEIRIKLASSCKCVSCNFVLFKNNFIIELTYKKGSI